MGSFSLCIRQNLKSILITSKSFTDSSIYSNKGYIKVFFGSSKIQEKRQIKKDVRQCFVSFDVYIEGFIEVFCASLSVTVYADNIAKYCRCKIGLRSQTVVRKVTVRNSKCAAIQSLMAIFHFCCISLAQTLKKKISFEKYCNVCAT